MITYLLLYRRGLHSPVRKKVVDSEFDAEYYTHQFIDFAKSMERMYAARNLEHVLFTFKMSERNKLGKFIDAEYKLL